MPVDFYNLNSAYGSVDKLKACIAALHDKEIQVRGFQGIEKLCGHCKRLQTHSAGYLRVNQSCRRRLNMLLMRTCIELV